MYRSVKLLFLPFLYIMCIMYLKGGRHITDGKKPFNQSAYVQGFIKTHYKRFSILLNKDTDADIIAQLDKQANRSAYVKHLIREDIERQ